MKLSITNADLLELYRAHNKSLQAFIKYFWRVIEPDITFCGGWHIDAICDHLEAVSRLEIKKLIINIPPRHSKSLITSVFWPAWEWTLRPGTKFLSASYSQKLATRDCLRARRIIESDRYQLLYGDVFQLASDQNEKMRYDNMQGGYRITSSVDGAGVTGEGGDIRLLDDPHDPKRANSDAERTSAIDWFKETWGNRYIDPKDAREVIIMQRLHERDVTGYALEEIGNYELLCLPGLYENPSRCTTYFRDPRASENEILWGERFGQDEVDSEKKRLGGYGFASQWQQRPGARGGTIFKHQWIKFWYPIDVAQIPAREIVRSDDGAIVELEQAPLPLEMDSLTQSWDCAFKKTETSSRVAGHVYGKVGSNSYLLDRDSERRDIIGTMDAIRTMTARWPNATQKYIEDKANGPAVIDMLKNEIPGLIPAGVKGDKVERAHAAAPILEAGNLWLPHPVIYPWVRELISQLTAFPNSSVNDDVDAMTQYVNKCYNGNDVWFLF